MGALMARFFLLSSHSFNTMRGAAFYEAGTEIDSSEILNFRCTAHMQALDAEAEALLADECDRNRAAGADGSVIGFGPTQTLPA